MQSIRLHGLCLFGAMLCAAPVALAQQDRVSSSEKGSLLIWSKIEVAYQQDQLIQDTFVSLTNDWATDVDFQLYLIQGDNTNPLGYWQFSDVGFTLTRDQPVYWSAATGQGTAGIGMTRWSDLGPGIVIDGVTYYRGLIIGWATSIPQGNRPIRHNHLAGHGTVVNYVQGWAFEYNTWAFAAITGTQGGLIPVIPDADGSVQLRIGTDYVPSFNQLLLNFQAWGSSAWSTPDYLVVSDTALTLHPVDWDLRENSDAPPVITKAQFDVWNENEVKFSGAYKCVVCWDQSFLRTYGIPNHFGVGALQTNHGKARIDGVASPLCNLQVPGVLSVATSLLGISERYLEIGMPGAGGGTPAPIGGYAAAASNLIGMGTQPGLIRYFPGSGPDEAPGSNSPATSFDRLLESALKR